MRQGGKRVKRGAIVGLLCLATLLTASRGLLAQKKVGRRWAILIGVDDYIQMNDLKYCGADQQALSRVGSGVCFDRTHG